ncbi:MAG TPA: hypothetical protein VHO06_16935, partial [Polyangia bacterium]|nr:hypothetical protein [Polyangia bacterium]
MRSRTKHRSALALLPLAAAILGGCGGQGASASVKIVYGDGGGSRADGAADAAPAEAGPSYCCVLQ